MALKKKLISYIRKKNLISGNYLTTNHYVLRMGQSCKGIEPC